MYFNNSSTGFLKCLLLHTGYRNTRCKLNQGRFQMIAGDRTVKGDKVFLTLSSNNPTIRWCTGIEQSFRTGQRGLAGRPALIFWSLLSLQQVTQRPPTAGALFKASMIALADKLAAKVRLYHSLNVDTWAQFFMGWIALSNEYVLSTLSTTTGW